MLYVRSLTDSSLQPYEVDVSSVSIFSDEKPEGRGEVTHQKELGQDMNPSNLAQLCPLTTVPTASRAIAIY